MTTGPMVICFVLDFISSKTILKKQWISEFLLILMLIVPDIIILVTFNKGQKLNPSFITLTEAKMVGIVGSLLSSIQFDSVLSREDSKLFDLLLVSITPLYLLGKILLLLNRLNEKPSLILYFFGISMHGLGNLVIATALGILIRSLWPQISAWTFHSYEVRADFCRMCALLIYGGTGAVLLFSDYPQFILILQVSLVYFLTVISSRTFKLIAKEKERKLDEKLDLIRYISHEMRNPLNSASLGISLALDNAHNIKNSVETLTYLVGASNHISGCNGCLEKSKENEKSDDNERIPCCSERLKNFIMNKIDVEPLDILVTALLQVRDSCLTATSTLDDILTFDKLDDEKMSAEFTDLNPFQVLRQNTTSFELTARELGIDLEVYCEDVESRWFLKNVIRGDQFKLAQISRNLLSNAFKFTPKGGKVKVSMKQISYEDSILKKRSDPELCNKLVRLTVSDTGAGISSENLPKIFGKYVQVKPGELQQGKGSGLGLWITKRIVMLHQGSINVTSDGEGFGCSFSIDLPLYLPKEDMSFSESGITSLTSPLRAKFGSMSAPEQSDRKDNIRNHSRNTSQIFGPFSKSEDGTCKSSFGEKPGEISEMIQEIESRFGSHKHFLDDDDIESGNHSNIPLNDEFEEDDKKGIFSRVAQIFETENKSKNYYATSRTQDLDGEGRGSSVVSASGMDELSLPSNPAVRHRRDSVDSISSNKSKSRSSPIPGSGDSVGSNRRCNRRVFPANNSPSDCVKIQSTHETSWDKGIRFMVVDDSLSNRKITSAILSSHGHLVLLANDGQECIDLYLREVSNFKMDSRELQQVVDVILMDNNMPRVSGVEATRKLRDLGYTGLIYGITGDTDEETKRRFLESGANDVLTKPLDLKKLYASLCNR